MTCFFLSWLLCAFPFLPFYTDNTLTWLELSLAMAPGFWEFPFVQTTRTSFQGMLCFPFLRFFAFFSWSACANIASPVTSYCELSPVKPPFSGEESYWPTLSCKSPPLPPYFSLIRYGLFICWKLGFVFIFGYKTLKVMCLSISTFCFSSLCGIDTTLWLFEKAVCCPISVK